ncbi:MAG: ABC transporter substrate-binding protein [Deltaproteobacteria bacterium]|nr:MAG: ABC transporter substrate-binding protein [Deltaproteobacteria bacterium]
MNRLRISGYWLVLGPGFLFSCLLTILSITSCTQEPPVLLGYVGGLSGRVADLGISGRNGAILAVENINSAGGVNGKKIKLVVKDDKQESKTAEKAVKDMIDQGVIAVIGHMTSSMSVRTVPIVNDNKVVMMSPTTTTTYLSDKDDYFFRVSNTTKSYATKMARHLYHTLGFKKVAVVYDLRNKAYTESWLEDFRQEFEKSGGSIVRAETFHSGPDVQFFDIITQVMLPDVNALVIAASALDTAMLCQQVNKIGRNTTIAASEWAATEKLLEMGGAAVEGVIVSQFFNRNSTDPDYLKFREEYIKRFGNEPGFASVNSYDAVNIVLEAFKKQKQGKLAKETMQEITKYFGVQGPITINKYGDADRETFLSVVQNGDFVAVQ